MCSMATKNKKPVKASRCSRSLYTESDIEEAIRQHEELGISIRAAARNHDIPEATLRHKISGYHPVSKKMGPPMLLTDAEEKVLVNYILLSCDRARPVTKHNVLNAVATILSDERERGYKRVQPAACKEIPGEKWWSLPLHTSQPHFQGSQRPSAPSSAAYVASVSSPSASSTPTPGSSQCNPGQDQGNTKLPISPAFRCFNFYPERRAGKGPKKVKTVLDRVYAISSSKMVEELQRQRNEKQSQEEEKQRKLAEKQSKQKKSTGPKRKVPSTRPTKKICAPPATEDTDSNSSDELAIEEIVNNSSDDSIDIDDGGDFGIKLPLEDPQQYSWVGVKVDKVQPSTSGRAQTSSFEIYIGKVLEVNDDGGFTVSFVKQKTDTFYFFPQIEDVSYPVHKDEMVVIDSPISQVQNRLMGFVFPSGIKLSCKSYFQKYLA